MAALERHERWRVVGAEPVEVGAVLAAQVEEVLEAGRRDEGGAGAAALEQRIGRDRRPVGETLDSVAPSASTAASTDSSWRAPVGTFAVCTPCSSTRTASVNVPPTSTPRKATV